MTDRLRRLDALFAERVLGRSLTFSREFVVDDVTNISVFPVPRYTRSLDAAWEGMVVADMRISHMEGGAPRWVEICVSKNSGDMDRGWFEGGPCDHPAEALVLACLRAVGVSEEELK